MQGTDFVGTKYYELLKLLFRSLRYSPKEIMILLV